jgi:hypothetical protein
MLTRDDRLTCAMEAPGRKDTGGPRVRAGKYRTFSTADDKLDSFNIYHTPSDFVVECVTAHRKPPEVRIWTLRHQSAVGALMQWTRPPMQNGFTEPE